MIFLVSLPAGESSAQSKADFQGMSEIIEVVSGPAPLRSIVEKVKEPFEKESGIKLEVIGQDGMSAPNVIIAIDSRKAEVGFVGADWNSLLELVERNGHKIKDREKLVRKVVGSEPTNFIVHPSGPASLSDEDLYKLLTGKVTNWKELGGKNAQVQIAAPQKFPATIQMIADRFLKKEALRPGVKYFNTFEEIVDFVATTPGALAFGSASVVTPRVKQPQHSRLDRTTLFVTYGEPSAKAQKLLDFIEKTNKATKPAAP